MARTTKISNKKILLFFWYDLRSLLISHKELWHKVDIDNADKYDWRNGCDNEACWYKLNSDRLDKIQMFTFDDWSICDVCWDNKAFDNVLDTEHIYEIEQDLYILDKNLRTKILSFSIKDT
jgi:hypothetical protein